MKPAGDVWPDDEAVELAIAIQLLLANLQQVLIIGHIIMQCNLPC
jgi:hypothetical protein